METKFTNEISLFREFISQNKREVSIDSYGILNIKYFVILDFDSLAFKGVVGNRNKYGTTVKESLSINAIQDNVNFRLIDFSDTAPLTSLKFCFEDTQSTSQVFLHYSFWFHSFCIVFYDGSSKSRIINYNGGDYLGFSFVPETAFHETLNSKLLSLIDDKTFTKLSPEILNMCANNIVIDKTYYQYMSVFDLLFTSK